MTENSPNSAEGVQGAAAVAKNFVEEYQNSEWKRISGTDNENDHWLIKYKIEGSKTTQSVTVEKETGNIVDTNLSNSI